MGDKKELVNYKDIDELSVMIVKNVISLEDSLKKHGYPYYDNSICGFVAAYIYNLIQRVKEQDYKTISALSTENKRYKDALEWIKANTEIESLSHILSRKPLFWIGQYNSIATEALKGEGDAKSRM